jgi:transcriptional regulator with XRE-family HTH domain
MNTKAFNDILGREIKRIREERRITQEELASRMNVNAQNISSYERGERCPSLFWMNRLYTALGIDPAKFTEDLYQRLKEESTRNPDGESVSPNVTIISPVSKKI